VEFRPGSSVWSIEWIVPSRPLHENRAGLCIGETEGMSEISGLWTCPECGRKLVGRNMYHSCTDATVEDFPRKAGPDGRALYDRFESMVAACGPYCVSPAKTRIASMARVRFAGVTAVSRRGMTCGFSLPEPIANPRFSKVDEVVPGWWSHTLRVTRPEELDDEVQGWLRGSYRLKRMQKRLSSGPSSLGRIRTLGDRED